MYTSLLNHVSVNEMMEMRENEKMSNQEIAERLGVTSQCIRNYIGKQPPELRKYRSKRVVYPPSVQTREPVMEEEPAACLVVSNRVITLTGKDMEYHVDYSKGVVRMHRQTNPNIYWLFKLEEIENIIVELKAITRRSGDIRMSPEMW